jgi:hypothetical protein
MIEKEPGQPYLHRLRVIHLYEATLNAFLGIKYRELLHYAEDHDLLNPGCYGSRPGRQALDPVLIEILQYEYVMATRLPHLKFNNDATSCYDRMLAHITTIIAQAYGLATPVAKVQGTFLQTAQYFIKTMLGVSQQSYSHSEDAPIFGNGQGSMSSPTAWGFCGSLLFDVFDSQCTGARYSDPTGVTKLSIGMVGFVDDNNCQTTGDHSTTVEELVATAQHDAQLWRDILYASGGELELPKCYYHLLWVNFSASGHPVLQPGQFGPPLILQDANGQDTQIRQYSALQSHKILGSYQAPISNQRPQYQDLLSKARLHARTVASSHVRPHEAWIYYYSVFLRSVGYPLGVSHLSPSQLDNLQRPMVSITLQKMGYTRSLSRAIAFGPSRYGGLDFRDLRTEQGLDQIQLVMRHLRTKDSQAGKLLRITLASLQMSAGVGFPLLQRPSVIIPHLDGFWIKSIRSFLSASNAFMTLSEPNPIALQREKDFYLMEVAMASKKFSARDIRIVNACRLYLQVHTASDITSPDGFTIPRHIYEGRRDPSLSFSRLRAPRQERPTDPNWTIWRRLLNQLGPTGRLRQPLGRWTANNSRLRRHWQYLYSPKSHQVVSHLNGRYQYHPKVRTCVFHSHPAYSRSSCPDGIPVPVDVIRDGLRIPRVFPAEIPRPMSPPNVSFTAYIAKQPEHISTLFS